MIPHPPPKSGELCLLPNLNTSSDHYPDFPNVFTLNDTDTQDFNFNATNFHDFHFNDTDFQNIDQSDFDFPSLEHLDICPDPKAKYCGIFYIFYQIRLFSMEQFGNIWSYLYWLFYVLNLIFDHPKFDFVHQKTTSFLAQGSQIFLGGQNYILDGIL